MIEPKRLPIEVTGEPHPNINCLLLYACIEGNCEFLGTCAIYQKVSKMARNRHRYYNYGIKSGRHHEWDGRLVLNDIRIIYLKSLRDGFHCPDCKELMVLGGNLPNSATVDHIVSRSQGGKNNKENLRICCAYCNTLKSVME